MQAKFGEVLSPFAIEKLTMAKNQKVIIGVLSENIVITKTHFIPDVGFIHCFEGKCCEDNGLPSVRYGLHVVKYTTDGNISIINDDLEFLLLAVGQKDYKNLITKDQILKQQGSALIKKDLLVTCTEEQFQNKTFDLLGDARWRKIMSKELFKEKMDVFSSSVESIFGRKVDEASYVKLVSQLTAGPVIDRQTVDQARKSLPQPKPAPRPAPRQVAAPVSAAPAEDAVIDIQAEEAPDVVSTDDFDDLLD